MVGISDRELSNIEIGKVNPRYHTVHAISRALDVSLDYWIEYETWIYMKFNISFVMLSFIHRTKVDISNYGGSTIQGCAPTNKR